MAGGQAAVLCAISATILMAAGGPVGSGSRANIVLVLVRLQQSLVSRHASFEVSTVIVSALKSMVGSFALVYSRLMTKI